MNKNNVKLVAYYLPQYHPVPENDRWWGKGFTEWTNVTKAKPMFKGHYQPRLPADLGFYDLRIPEVREQQAELAREYGVHGFCYYHYWFGDGKQLLERPIKEVLESGKPDFPFMFCWANHKWTSHWLGNDTPEVLVDQQYFGKEDYKKHFQYLLPYFQDERYIRIDGKVAFQIYKPFDIPDLDVFISVFQELAARHGLGEIYFIGGNCDHHTALSLSSINGFTSNELGSVRRKTEMRLFPDRRSFAGKVETKLRAISGRNNFYNLTKPVVIDFDRAVRYLIDDRLRDYDYFHIVVPDWDNTARAGKKALIFKDSTPELWEGHLRSAVEATVKQHRPEKQFLFVKSWNEWAEGNYLEPDMRWGHLYLEKIKTVLSDYAKRNID